MDVDKKTGELSPQCPKCAHGGNVDLFPDKRMCMACGHVYPKTYLSDLGQRPRKGAYMDNQKRIALEPNMGEITNTSARLSNEATKTPRTDAELKLEAFFDGAGIVETVLVEFAEQLETELADARAEIERLDHQRRAGWTEIERLKGEHEKSLDRAKNYILKLSDTVTKQAGELFAKDRLIEQMRKALRAWTKTPDLPLHEAIKITNAALEAAERGGK